MQRLFLAVGSIVLLTTVAYSHPFPTKRVANPALTLVDDGGGDGGNSDAANSDDGTGNPVTENSDATDSSDGTGKPDAAAGAAGGTPQPAPPKFIFENEDTYRAKGKFSMPGDMRIDDSTVLKNTE